MGDARGGPLRLAETTPAVLPTPFWRVLCASTGVSVALQTLVDLVLLERKYAFVRGGFLADQFLSGALARVQFLALSLLSDAIVLAPLIAALLALARSAGLRTYASALAATSLALAPLLASTFVSYELAGFLGRDADVSLMYGLVGHRATEFLAVAGPYLRTPAFIAALGAVTLAIATAILQRRATTRCARPTRSVAIALLVLVVAGTGTQVAVRATSDTFEYGLSRKASGGVIGMAVARLTDVDRDGYGLLQRPRDPDLLDGRIYPWALDVPANGVDEDGVGGDLPTALPAYTERPAPRGPWLQTPNVLLVLLESVRADAVGARVDGRPVTPVLDRLAAEGVAASQAYSHNGFTYQSRHHLFSGSLANLRGPATLVDDFKAHGYEVAYFSGQDETFGGPSLSSGYARADVFFQAPDAASERYTRFATPGSLAVPFSVVEHRIDRFLNARALDRPLFLYVNFHDTHFPYHHGGVRPLVSETVVPPDRIGPSTADPLRRMYLNTVANVDAAIGRVADAMRQHTTGPLAVIVTSDHGESLFDDGFLGHGFALTEAQTRVPFVVSGLAMRLREPFGHADVRDALWSALQDATAQPRLDAGGRVFQYIGSVEQPRVIAERSAAAFIAVDLYRGRTRVNRDESPTLDRASISGTPLNGLVRSWERMRLAQQAPGSR